LLGCTSWQHKDQPLRLYRANQHGLPLENVLMREPIASGSWSEKKPVLQNLNPITV